MIPKDCKRLAEVDFPIAEVSRHAAREKSIRHGHPSTLHLWWARRPLASSRAMLLGLLLPDPCDPLCPMDFKEQARKFLPKVACNPGTTDEDLRKAILRFIGISANWDLASDRTYLEVSRALVKAAHGEVPPLVVDPFAGGGSIPLEALRLGCEAFASDLNPVACLILKVMLEDIPRGGTELAEELRRLGAEIKRQTEQELADLYPKDLDSATPIAYLWARTVRCESPNCGAEIPLVRSLWLCQKAKRRRALRHRIVRSEGKSPRVEFEVFEPKTEKDVSGSTVTRAKATCLACGAVLAPQRVRAQLTQQRGGAGVVFDATGGRTGGALLLAVVTLVPGQPGRHYRVAEDRDYAAVREAQERVAKMLDDWKRDGEHGLRPTPDEPTPVGGGSGAGRAFSLQRYGMMRFEDLYAARQLLTLSAISKRVAALGREAQGTSLRECAALVASRCADYNSAYARWTPSGEFVGDTFGRQALGPSWQFCEPAIFQEESGSFYGAVEWVARVVELQGSARPRVGQVQAADACHSPLPDASCDVWFTDPPYYDAVPYSDLSDYFFVWLKRALPEHPLLRDIADPRNPLTPKIAEAVQDETKLFDGRPKDSGFFERAMGQAFSEGRRALKEDGVGCVVFAHKTTEGWEALLTGIIAGGWTITGSWPVATERPGRLRSQESAALATSVHLVCRPRPEDAKVGDWADVLRELPNRVGDLMERLQSEGVRGADLVFACIGPALEIFSRYAHVETAEGREVALAEYLEKVWEVVGRSALEQVLGTAEAKARNGAAGAVEEDARLTALFLWTLQSTNADTLGGTSDEGEAHELDDEDDEGGSPSKAKGFTLVFDVVRRFAQPLGVDLPKWEGRVIETKQGVVRLLPIAERARQLFGEDGAQAVAARLEQEAAGGSNPLQGLLFPDIDAAPTVRGRGRVSGKRAGVGVSDDSLAASRDATTLDRIHAAMLLQSGGRTNALRALLKAEQERGSDFLRLANALSALYPKGSEEKRVLDAMLLAVPR
ncbi:MAG: DUF1156 domain-containing protein [Candidatus Dormibacteria bacterium]